jgi:protein TonB
VTALPKQALPAAPVIAAKTETVTASAPKVEPRSLAAQPRTPEIPKTPAAPNSWGGDAASTNSKASEVKTQAPLVAPPAAKTLSTPANSQAHLSGEALKRESARLQEQLSAMLFNTETPSTSAANKQVNGDSSAKVIEMTKSQAPPTKTASPAKSPSGLDSSEVKIPSWLEPLARNAGTPAQNEITTDTPDSDEGVEYEVQDLSAPANSEQPPAAPSSEAMPDLAEISEISASERRPAKNNKVILIAAAAAGFLLLAVGTTWYVRQSPSASSQAAITAEAPSSSAAVQPTAKSSSAAPSGSNSGNGAATFNSAPIRVSASAATSPAINSQPTTPTAQPLKAASDKNTAAELSAYRKLAEPPQPVQPQSKKSSFGDVRLAAPSAARRPAVQEAGAVELAPSIGHIAPTGDALGGGLAGGGSKPLVPSAPLPVGGDVKQARLLSSTPPLYPVLAKTQHIEGNVRVDALVDENGKISAMKVISGPTLLHQAAMDAVRQWKYQPATLDGKTVPMHLTVTLQFKLQ